MDVLGNKVLHRLGASERDDDLVGGRVNGEEPLDICNQAPSAPQLVNLSDERD